MNTHAHKHHQCAGTQTHRNVGGSACCCDDDDDVVVIACWRSVPPVDADLLVAIVPLPLLLLLAFVAVVFVLLPPLSLAVADDLTRAVIFGATKSIGYIFVAPDLLFMARPPPRVAIVSHSSINLCTHAHNKTSAHFNVHK